MSALAGGRALVVEDDEDVRAVVEAALCGVGMEVEAVSDCRSGLASAGARRPDVVILDLVLPGEDGLDLLARIREHSDVPVVVVSGRRSETDRVVALDLGADDYLVKPFSERELVARVRAVVRRVRHPMASVLELGDLRLVPGDRRATLSGRPLRLTRREFDLLLHLARRPGQVHSREELLRAVWGSSEAWQDPATVTEHVRRLRRRLGDDAERPRWIVTIRGVGYCLADSAA